MSSWALMAIAAGGFWWFPQGSPACSPNEANTMQLSSTSFTDEGPIPNRHTCEGADTSPQLGWSGVTTDAKSLALIVDDPDAPDPSAPKRTWTHWVVYNIPPEMTSLPEGSQMAPFGASDGRNDWGHAGYRGPCPPVGRHRYFFRLFALNTRLDGLENPTSSTLRQAMTPHVVGQATLMGTYQMSSPK